MKAHDSLSSLIAEVTEGEADFALARTRDFMSGQWQWEAWAHGVDEMLSRDQSAPRFHASHATAEGAVRGLMEAMQLTPSPAFARNPDPASASDLP